MTDNIQQQPWVDLKELLAAGSAPNLESFLTSLPADDVARGVLRLSDEERKRVLRALSAKAAARVLEQLPESEAANLLEGINAADAATIVEQLPSDERADILRGVERWDADEILAQMAPDEARQARAMAGYSDDVAGGLMITEYLSYPQTPKASEVVHDLRINADKYRGYNVQYIYVTGDHHSLVGVVNLRDLILGEEKRTIGELMIRNPAKVADTATLDDLRGVFDQHHYLAVPVVDDANRLVGVVRAVDVEEALSDRGASDYRQSQGIIGGDELRTMPLWLRARRRLSWLSVNVLLNIMSASVIALYQDTLSAAIALAVFLPIISDMSGCSGNQAVAVSIRELALGLVRPNELARVWISEILVGVINGMVLGAVIACVAWFWKANVFLGFVVGASLAANTLIAVSIGGLVPLLLKRLRMDPALASGPILTTITDMCGFFLVLRLATAVLPRLAA
jgi:magnesium transporter